MRESYSHLWILPPDPPQQPLLPELFTGVVGNSHLSKLWGPPQFSRWNDVPKAQLAANSQTKEKGRRNIVTVTKTDDSSQIEEIAVGHDLIASDLSPFTPSYRFPINDDEEQ